MAFMTIVFQNEKKTFQLRNFVPFTTHVSTTFIDTVFSQKKVKQFLIFVFFDVLFVDVGHVRIIAGLEGFLWKIKRTYLTFSFCN